MEEIIIIIVDDSPNLVNDDGEQTLEKRRKLNILLFFYGTLDAIAERLTTALRVTGSIPAPHKYLYGLMVVVPGLVCLCMWFFYVNTRIAPSVWERFYFNTVKTYLFFIPIIRRNPNYPAEEVFTKYFDSAYM